MEKLMNVGALGLSTQRTSFLCKFKFRLMRYGREIKTTGSGLAGHDSKEISERKDRIYRSCNHKVSDGRT